MEPENLIRVLKAKRDLERQILNLQGRIYPLRMAMENIERTVVDLLLDLKVSDSNNQGADNRE